MRGAGRTSTPLLQTTGDVIFFPLSSAARSNALWMCLPCRAASERIAQVGLRFNPNPSHCRRYTHSHRLNAAVAGTNDQRSNCGKGIPDYQKGRKPQFGQRIAPTRRIAVSADQRAVFLRLSARKGPRTKSGPVPDGDTSRLCKIGKCLPGYGSGE